MTDYWFEAEPAVTEDGDLVQGATLQAFALADTGDTTPLTVTLDDGTTGTTFTTTAIGLRPRFMVVDQPRVRLRAGIYSKVVVSWEWLLQAAQEAQLAAEEARDAAVSAVAGTLIPGGAVDGQILGWVDGAMAWVDVAGVGGAGGHTIVVNGVTMPARGTLELNGSALDAVDDATGDTTTVTVDAAPVVHEHSADDITAGTLAIARIPTGDTDTTVAIGDDSRITGALQEVTIADLPAGVVVFALESGGVYTRPTSREDLLAILKGETEPTIITSGTGGLNSDAGDIWAQVVA